MGEAKSRGTYEERKANSIADQKAALSILKKQDEEWLLSLSESERENVLTNRIKTKARNAFIKGWKDKKYVF